MMHSIRKVAALLATLAFFGANRVEPRRQRPRARPTIKPGGLPKIACPSGVKRNAWMCAAAKRAKTKLLYRTQRAGGRFCGERRGGLAVRSENSIGYRDSASSGYSTGRSAIAIAIRTAQQKTESPVITTADCPSDRRLSVSVECRSLARRSAS